MRCEARCWAYEEKVIKAWNFSKVMFVKAMDDNEALIDYKKMLILVYEMSCRMLGADFKQKLIANIFT
jgi:hypothetical protein